MEELAHNQERILECDPKGQYGELKPQISWILWNITENDTKDILLMGFKIESINPASAKLQPQLSSLKG